jgi:hypothetical protein
VKHPSTPPELIERAAGHPDEDVVHFALTNKKAPGSMLTRLATSSEYRIRGEVARHPNTPVEILERLLADPEKDDVAGQALRNLASRGILTYKLRLHLPVLIAGGVIFAIALILPLLL